VELARQCGIVTSAADVRASLQVVTGEAPAAIRARVHFARAIALEPALLILEHPGAELAADERLAFGDTIAEVTNGKQVATLVITNDEEFAKRAAHRALRLEPATGALKPIKKGWFR